MNHPNRGRRVNPAANPTPDEIRAARSRAGLTQREAAALVHATVSAWEEWEQGRRRMHPGLFELLLIKTGVNHPRLKSGACEDPQAKRVQRQNG